MSRFVRCLAILAAVTLMPLASATSAHAEEISRSTAPTTSVPRVIPRAAAIKVTVNTHGSKILSRASSLWKDGRRIYDWTPVPGTYKVKSVIRWQQVITSEDEVWQPDPWCADYSYDGYDACAEGNDGYYDYATSTTLGAISTVTRWNTVTVSTDYTPGCVTTSEFNGVKDGMTRVQVHYSFGTAGRVTSFGSGGESREYRTCAGDPDWSYAEVDYEWRNGAYRVWWKWLYISY
jgi:hypothetical protein